MIAAERAWPIALVLVLFLARAVELRTRRNVVPGIIRERATFRLFLAAGVLMIAASISEYLLLERGLRWFPFTAGLLCAAVSFWIRRRAIVALGEFWSLHVEIRQSHRLVRSGPYLWIRHPAYLSMALELVATGLLLNAYYSLLVIPAVFVPTLIWRLRLEESAMIEKFGDAYRAYQRATPALLPYKRPASR